MTSLDREHPDYKPSFSRFLNPTIIFPETYVPEGWYGLQIGGQITQLNDNHFGVGNNSAFRQVLRQAREIGETIQDPAYIYKVTGKYLSGVVIGFAEINNEPMPFLLGTIINNDAVVYPTLQVLTTNDFPSLIVQQKKEMKITLYERVF